MATFTSKPAIVEASAQAVADKFADLSRLQELIDKMPAEDRAKVGEVSFTTDSIVMKTPQVGEITLKVVERTPAKVVFTALGSPVPMHLAVNIRPESDDKSEIVTAMDVEIPAFLKAMVGGTMQKAVDQFGQLMQKIV
ncbi:MAG: hypothetical protein J6B13_09465 [Muribaculaceae bacterium]|nr:hypothetical protein [Muribaculaceae bacterium]